MSRHPLDLRTLSPPPGCHLTPLAPTVKRKCGSVLWRCRCACKRVVLVAAESWRTGKKRHCGCQAHREPRRKGWREHQADERRIEVRRLRGEGMTLQEIGQRVGITTQRAQQMVQEDCQVAAGKVN